MRVFALGGYGTVGFPAIKLLAQSDLVTEITIAGRSLERAEIAAEEAGDKAKAIQIDGTDEHELASLLSGYDIVMNAARDETVLPAIRAAIRTRTDYCDVNHIFVEQALQLTTSAETAGVTAIVANGVAPGIINLMGVQVARQLQEIQQLQNGRATAFWWGGLELAPQPWPMDENEILATIRMYKPFFLMMLKRLQQKGSRTAWDYDDGQWIQKDPMEFGLAVPLMRGRTTTLYPYAVRDPMCGALPGELASFPPVEAWFSPLPPQLHEMLREQALLVLEDKIESETAVNSFYEAIEADPHFKLTFPDDLIATPKEWARAVGWKEGRAARYSCWFTEPMWKVGEWFLTSAALVLAARRILRDETQKFGVMTAEIAFDPPPFFDELTSLIPNFPSDVKLVDESFQWL